MQVLTPDFVEPTRRRGEPEGTPGRCANLDYCSIGMHRVLVTVPIGQPFVCPECGGRLRPPHARRGGRTWLMPAIGTGLFLGGIGLGFAQGYFFARVTAVRAPAVTALSSDEARRIDAARAALGLKTAQEEAAPPAAVPAPKPAPPVETAHAAPPAPLVVARPFPLRPPPLDTVDPPPHLQQEERFGQVTVDCLVAAGDAPRCRVTNVRGGNAFSPQALDWLEHAAIRYAPEQRDGRAALLDHRWRVIFEDFSGTSLPPAR